MKIIVDTREQKPLEFKHKSISEVIYRKLDVGDYGCILEDGHEVPFVFDRKSKGDLWGTLTNGAKGKPQNYERFKREMQRAKEAGIHLMLIIEKSYSDMYKPYRYSKRPPSSIIKQVQTLHIRYGLTPIFCTTRSEMAKYITDFFIAYGEDYVKRTREARKKNKSLMERKAEVLYNYKA